MSSLGLAFAEFDLTILRSRFFSVCIPPPGLSIPLATPEPEQHPAQPAVFECRIHDDGSGHACGKTFETFRALSMHQYKVHGKQHVIRRLIITNMCPICNVRHKEVAYTQTHVLRSMERAVAQRCRLFTAGVCKGPGTQYDVNLIMPPKFVEDDMIRCPACAETFLEIDEFVAHIHVHLDYLLQSQVPEGASDSD